MNLIYESTNFLTEFYSTASALFFAMILFTNSENNFDPPEIAIKMKKWQC